LTSQNSAKLKSLLYTKQHCNLVTSLQDWWHAAAAAAKLT